MTSVESVITSVSNPRLKMLRELAESSRARRDVGKTLLDGVHLAQVCLDRGIVPELCVLSVSAASHDEVMSVRERCVAAGCPVLLVADAAYRSVSPVENGVGLMCLIAVPAPASGTALPPRLDRASVVLDRLQDPGNVGSILRSAAAAGMKQIICSPSTVQCWSPKVLRAAMGAHFMLDIFENVVLDSLLADAKIPVLATSSHATQTLYQIDLRGDVAWLFGHEGQGVATGLMPLATQQVMIPQQPEMESLNVAAAAAVCFFEQRRQRSV